MGATAIPGGLVAKQKVNSRLARKIPRDREDGICTPNRKNKQTVHGIRGTRPSAGFSLSPQIM